MAILSIVTQKVFKRLISVPLYSIRLGVVCLFSLNHLLTFFKTLILGGGGARFRKRRGEVVPNHKLGVGCRDWAQEEGRGHRAALGGTTGILSGVQLSPLFWLK